MNCPTLWGQSSQRAAEGLTCGVVSCGRVGRSTVVDVSGLALDCGLQKCVRVDMDTTENRYSPRPAFSIEIEGKPYGAG